MQVSIDGTVSSVVFANTENGFSILRLETDEGLVTVTGSIPGVSVGERLTLRGVWTTHPKFGEQLNVESFEIKPLSDSEDIYRYLASGAVKHIGPSKARDIVEKFGGDALHIIENEPDKLTSIRGISVRTARKISDEFRRHASLRRLIDFLTRYNIKLIVAARIYRDFGDDSLEIVRENPYLLTAEQYGAAFSEADAMALDMGFESDCPERVSAACIFVLTHNLNNGHVFISKEKLIPAAGQLIGANHETIKEALFALCECGEIVIEAIAGVEGCYLRHLHEAELYAARRLSEMTALSYVEVADGDGIREIINRVEREQGIEYADMQKMTLELAAKNGVIVLTGGPGTGKTTTVRGILTLFDAMNLKTALCAPTGRAAKRLSETCFKDAATIHRLLGARLDDDGALSFDHDENNPLNADAVIVDESSMIDILLMRALLAGLKTGCRLVMVGDADQLPPVGPGFVFADIIRSGAVPTVSLSEIFRQAADSGIIKCAHDVNNGIMPDLTAKYTDLFFMRRQSEELIAEAVTELFSERLPKNMGIDPSQIQVLTPTLKSIAGTALLNNKLREAVNPKTPTKKEKQSGDFIFRVGDKVMQIRNNYDIVWKSDDGLREGTGVFNGDIGVIKDIDFGNEMLTVDYEDKLVVYLFEQLLELEPAFAMTVHKSQGSEYQAVILALAPGVPALLIRGVLYTAMTRAKKLLVIIGQPEIMERMVHNERKHRRYSGLRARLAESGS